MKVLWFTNTSANAELSSGGVNYKGGWIQGLNKVLENRLELHIAFLNPGGPKTLKQGKTTYHSVMPPGWKWRMIKKSLFRSDPEDGCLKLYLDIVNEVKPDLIHIFGTEKQYIKIIRYTDIPVLVSLQGILSCISVKYSSGFENRLLKKVKANRGLTLHTFFPLSFYKEKQMLLKKASTEREFLPDIKFIDGRTDWDRRVSGILSPDSVYFHIDRILREEFYNARWEDRRGEKLKIHSTAGPNLFKGVETICGALHELNQLNIITDWSVAGISGDDPVVKITKLKLKDRFPNRGLFLLGRLAPAELISYLRRCNMYVMASHIENSPNNLAEAMIMGVPCIATFSGGTGSYLRDGEEGILIQEGDHLALAGAIIELYRNRELAGRYGDAARKSALIRHDREKIVNELTDIYKKIIENSK